MIFTADVNNQRSVELSHRNSETRDVPIADAFVFAARKLDGDVFVDGWLKAGLDLPAPSRDNVRL